MNSNPFPAAIVIIGVCLLVSAAETLRYRLGGDWRKVAGLSDAGWGLNPNNEETSGERLPGAADEARINWAGNTLTVSSEVPDVRKIEIGDKRERQGGCGKWWCADRQRCHCGQQWSGCHRPTDRPVQRQSQRWQCTVGGKRRF